MHGKMRFDSKNHGQAAALTFCFYHQGTDFQRITWIIDSLQE